MRDAITISTPTVTLHRLDWRSLPVGALREDSDIRNAWDGLNRARGDLPFLCADAVFAAAEAFGDGSERMLVASEGGTPALMAVLVPLGRLRWSTFQPSQLPLGAWVAQARLRPVDVGRCLLRGPLRMSLSVSLTQLDPRFAPREEDAVDTEHSDYIRTGWIDVQGSFQDYWAARGKNLRQNMRKQRNKLAAEGIKTRLLVWRRPEEMAPALARYGELESAGWKAAQGTAVHPQNAQGRFYRRLLEEAAQRGEALVYEYRFDERCVAMNLCLQRGGVLVVLKTAYDESIQLFSPAFLLREDELRAIFAAGEVQRIEYYGRLMDWHTRLTDKWRTLHHLTVYRWPLLKTLARLRRRPQAASESQSADY